MIVSLKIGEAEAIEDALSYYGMASSPLGTFGGDYESATQEQIEHDVRFRAGAEKFYKALARARERG